MLEFRRVLKEATVDESCMSRERSFHSLIAVGKNEL